MVTNSTSPFFGKLFEPLVMGLLRCILDRNMKKHLRKLTNWEEEKAKQGGGATND
jgi:hypothetical protein